ncbi:hypothetical protein GCM10025864_21480 [Luteimicrobium album]|uniref:Uncharacterized protein n=1 Tax=Luteimicrobium album TaxID=1054550 RepID=A0ABQ6I356_9MICO|nr:hypothetical protein [Luteimicrobium album]GMA24389.1 hypothetical protein GCM10025864_21480 [Luteimicrobium album]
MSTTGLISMMSASALVVGAMTILVPTSAQAVARCATSADSGKYKETISKPSYVWDIPQRDHEENYSGAAEKITFEVTSSTSRTNSVGVKVDVGGQWAVFEAKVGVDLGTSSTKTSLTKTTRAYTLKSGDVYLFGQGTGRYTATESIYRCVRINIDGIYGWRLQKTSKVTGYTGRAQSVVGCKQKPKAGTMAAKLKTYCP